MPVGLRMRNSGEGRLNLTFRDVIGHLDETQFPKFRVSYNEADCIFTLTPILLYFIYINLFYLLFFYNM